MTRILPIEFQFELAYHPGNLIESYLENEKKVFFKARLEKQMLAEDSLDDIDPLDFDSSMETEDSSGEEKKPQPAVDDFSQNGSLQAQFLSSLTSADGQSTVKGAAKGAISPFTNTFPSLYDRSKFQARKRAAWKTVNDYRQARSYDYKLQYPNLQAGPVDSTDSSPPVTSKSPAFPAASPFGTVVERTGRMPPSPYGVGPGISDPQRGFYQTRQRKSEVLRKRGGPTFRGKSSRPYALPRDYLSRPNIVQDKPGSWNEYGRLPAANSSYQSRTGRSQYYDEAAEAAAVVEELAEGEPAVIVQEQAEFEQQEILSDSPEPVYTDYSVETQHRRQTEEKNMEEIMFRNMVDEAEKEFLPDRVGGKLPAPTEDAEEENKSERSNSEDPEDEFCEELESCIMEELVAGQKIELQYTSAQLKSQPRRISGEEFYDQKHDIPVNEKMELEPEEETHPQDPHPSPPRKAWWEECDEELWKLIFRYVGKKELSKQCVLVSKEWYRWIMESEELWEDMDLSGTQNMTTDQLVAIGRRKPKKLNLSWTGVSREDVETCLKLAEDGNLQFLSLAGCHWSAVEALKVCPSSLVEMDLRWVQGCKDSNFKRLIGDSPRLKQLESLFLSGCEVGDATVRLIANQFPKIKFLDMSYCGNITNLSLEVLCAAGSVARRTLKTLNLAGCSLLEAEIFGHLQKMQSLNHLDLRACEKLTVRECLEFEAACKAIGKNLNVMC